MRRTPITSDDVQRWKAQGLGLGDTSSYKPWIDVRCFSSKGRMSRRPGVTTARMHHLFSDNEDHFFLMADYAAAVLDIREQFPLFPEDATREIARSIGVSHPRYPYSTTPAVMTTDFLLTVVDKFGSRSLAAWSIKSADELRGRQRKTVLAKLEIERRYWLQRGVPWHLFTNEEFDQTVIDNLDWLSYFMVESEVSPTDFVTQLPRFLSAFEDASLQSLPLKAQLKACTAVLGPAVHLDLITDMFRFCVWHHLIDIDLRVPIGLQRIPVVLGVRKPAQTSLILRGNHGSPSASCTRHGNDERSGHGRSADYQCLRSSCKSIN